MIVKGYGREGRGIGGGMIQEGQQGEICWGGGRRLDGWLFKEDGKEIGLDRSRVGERIERVLR